MIAEEKFVSAALTGWHQAIGQTDKTLAALSDEDLQQEVAPGRNRVYYLLGHLVAVHDRLLPLLRLGERSHVELDEAFLAQPDKAVADTVSAAELRGLWAEVNAKLAAGLATLQPEEWLERHDAVSPEDFAKEPHRNRLSVLLSRTGHIHVHQGQIRLVKAK